eukprot:scaffold3540_cov147-Isochrysis_galbana.AAC.7
MPPLTTHTMHDLRHKFTQFTIWCREYVLFKIFIATGSRRSKNLFLGLAWRCIGIGWKGAVKTRTPARAVRGIPYNARWLDGQLRAASPDHPMPVCMAPLHPKSRQPITYTMHKIKMPTGSSGGSRRGRGALDAALWGGRATRSWLGRIHVLLVLWALE